MTSHVAPDSSASCHPQPAPAGEGLAFRRSPLVTRCSLLLQTLAPAALAFVLALLVLTPVQAQQTDRAKALGHRMVCMCGCKQILAECNHVGCTMSTSMLHKLDAEVASGKSDDLILQAFVQQFGAEVIAEPPAKGFNWLAWIMPFAVVGAGFLVVRSVLSRWSRPVAATGGAASPSFGTGSPVSPEVLDRIRRETEEDD